VFNVGDKVILIRGSFKGTVCKVVQIDHAYTLEAITHPYLFITIPKNSDCMELIETDSLYTPPHNPEVSSEIALKTQEQHLCHCELQVLLSGCKCGGK